MADDNLIAGWREFNGVAAQDTAHTNLLGARKEDPEKAAKQAALAKRWGVGLETARAQQPMLEQQARVEADRSALATAPKTAAWLAKDPVHAAISHDHVSDLTKTEQLVQSLMLTPRALASSVPALSAGMWGVVETAGAIADDAGVPGGSAVRSYAKQGRQTNLKAAEAVRGPESSIWAGRMWQGAAQSMGMSTPGIAASVITRNPAFAIAPVAAAVGGTAAGEALDKGKSGVLAGLYGSTQGVLEAVFERIPVVKLLDDLTKGTGFSRTLLNQMVREVPTEIGTTLTQNLSTWATLNPEKSAWEFLKEQPQAVLDTVAQTVMQVGGTTSVATLAQKAANRIAAQDQQAENAKPTAKAFNDLAKAVTALPLRERAPEAFEALMQELTPGVDVHINAQALGTYLQSVGPEDAQLLVDSLGVNDQLDAATPEQDIVIPAAKYLQHIAPTEAHKVLEQDIKLGPAGMSVREAEEHKAEREEKLAEVATRVLTRGNEIAQIEDPTERVRQHFYEQARAVGVPDEQAKANAAVQAAYYAQRAERNTSYVDAWAAYEAANISMKGQGATTEGPRGLTAGGSTFDHEGDQLFHGTRLAGLKKLKASTRGALGPGVYFTPNKNVAERYGDEMYAALEPAGVFNGLGSRDSRVNPYQVWRDQTAKLVAAAGDRGPEVQAIAERMQPADGYPFFKRIAQLYGSETEAQDLFKRAGFVGVSGFADGPEIALFDDTAVEAYSAAVYEQGPRGQVTFSDNGALIELFKSKNASTLIHEGAGHIWLENLARDAADPNASDEVRADLERVKDWWRANIDEAVKVSGLSKKRLLKAIDDFGGAPGMTAQQGETVFDWTPGGGSKTTKLGDTTIIYGTNGVSAEVISLRTPNAKRGKGSARQAMAQFLAEADARGLEVTLGASPLDKRTRLGPLVEFYRSLGFEPTGRKINMAGEPEMRRPAVTFEQDGSTKTGSSDIEAIRPFHELFARAAERYFMEGRSPSPGLRNVFAKFRNWLVSIYKDFTKLNVPMTDDIRGVFDRMIAGDAALADAQEEQALTPALTPEVAQKLGMSPAEYDAYVKTIQLADEASQDRLLGKLLGDIRRKYTEAWKSERAALVEEYQEQVNATPEMQALSLLENGTVRLSRDAVADVEARLYRRQRPYVFDEGLHPDVLADQVGMPSGQSLVEALLVMKEEHDALRADGDTRTVRRARAENLADAEMVARHGDILNDGTIGDEAIAALNETRRSEVLMSEVRALVRKAGETTSIWTPTEMEAWATREIAKRQLNIIRPHIFAVAEAKAGRDALKALVKDDFPAALDAKFRQLLNMYLFRAARDARETVDKGKTLFDNIATARNGTIAKSRNMDMVSAARAIIAPYGFGAARNDADYMAKVAQYDPELWADLRDGVTAALAGAKPVDELTLDEFVSLQTMVDQLWRMSRTSRQMQAEFEALELEDVANDLSNQLGTVTPRLNNRAPTNTEHAIRLVSGLRAALRRVESWAEGIDGGPTGPWKTYVWNPVSEAATRYRVAKAEYRQRFVEITRMATGLKKGKIDAPELGYTFGFANSGVGKGELLHALLHTGNASNKRKLLLGRGWAVERADGTLDTSAWDRFVDRMHTEGVVTAEDWAFVQGVWDLLEETKPDAQKAHRQVFGRYFEEVTAEPFTNQFGTFRGGYVPAIVDTFLVQEQALNAEADSITNANDASMFPSPARGFTKARVEYNKPLALDLGLLPQHIDKVLKFSHMTAPVRDVLRLLKETGLATKLEAFDPVAVPDLLLPWLNRSAKQMIETPSKGNAGRAADNFFRAVRTRTGMGIMMGNVINTLQQITGWLPATLKVRKRFLTSALFRVTMNPAQVADDIATMSPYMATRITAQAHEAQQQMEQLLLDPSKYEQVSKFAQKHAYVLQSMTQNMVDMVTWQAAFEQAVVQGQDFPEAVRFADSTIRQTQGSLAPEDVSRFETGSPFMRVFTQFYNYFGAQSNLLTTEFKNAPGMTRVGYVYMMGMLLPAVLAEVIRRAFGPGWDDDDDDGYLDMWLDVFFGSQFRYVTGMVPIAGPMLVNAANQLNDKPYDDTITPAPAFSSAAQIAGIPRDIYKLVTEGTGQKRTVRDTATLLTLLTGIPWFNAAARPLGYLADVNEGKVEPTSELDLARGLITGTASTASKQ